MTGEALDQEMPNLTGASPGRNWKTWTLRTARRVSEQKDDLESAIRWYEYAADLP